MVQRAVVTQLCQVCGLPAPTKDEMAAHVAEFHGANWPHEGEGIFMASRVKATERPQGPNQPSMAMFSASRRSAAPAAPESQMEFVPCLSRTPWGGELR
jgi:hypothetical protein